MKSKDTVKNTAINAFGTFFSRATGVIKFNVVNYFFGAGADTFYSANANILALRKVLGEGPLVNALLPVYSKVKNESAEEADRFASNIFNQIIIISLIVTVLGWMSMRFWTKLFLPGFASDPVAFNEIVNLTAVMLMSTLFFSTFSVGMAILNARGRFVSSANAPTLANLVFIFLPIFTYKQLGVMSLAWAVVIGTGLQACAEFVEMYMAGFRYSPRQLNFRDARSRNFWRLFLPASLTYLVQSGLSIGLGFFASFLPRGSITYLRNANTIVQAPVGFIGVALASAVFPLFATLKGDREKLFGAWEESVLFFAYLSLPVAALFTIYPDVIINSIFRDLTRLVSDGTGKYTQELLGLTITATAIQGSVLIPWSLTIIINRFFFALEKPFLPLIMYTANFVINIIGYMLVHHFKWGGMGLVSADVIAGWLTLVVSLVLVGRSVGKAYQPDFLKKLGFIAAASILCWIAALPLHRLYLWAERSAALSLLAAGALFVFGLGIFIFATRLLKLDPFIRKD